MREGAQDNAAIGSAGEPVEQRPTRTGGSPRRRRGASPVPPPHPTIKRFIVVYMLAVLGAFALCAVGLTLAQRGAALEETVRDAKVNTSLLATWLVQPALPLTTQPTFGADQRLDRIIRSRVLGDSITRVDLVEEAGLVVYSTDAGSVGQQRPLSAQERNALLSGLATASRDDGSDPTHLDHGRLTGSLRVSVGLRGPTGQALLLQTRQPYEDIWLTSRAVWLTLLPSLLLALTLLYLVKIGFAYRLSRGLYGLQEQREQLLLTTLAAADRERTLIASDLHDGVVQGLAGASYTLTDAANRTRAAEQPEVADTLADTARSLRQWVRELRSLIVTVTPPALHSEGLPATLSDLVATLEARRIDVVLDVRVRDALNETSESLVYRVAQEAIRNVTRHARASRVELIVAQDDGWLTLRLTDDGQGFDPAVSARSRGSVGLTLLAALVHERGGHLRVESAAGAGTVVTLRLPMSTALGPNALNPNALNPTGLNPTAVDAASTESTR